MNSTIQILDGYNKYQSKILKRINKLNKSLTTFNEIQNKIFTSVQMGGNYTNVSTFPRLQLNLLLMKNLININEIDEAKKLLDSATAASQSTSAAVDIIQKKMANMQTLTDDIITTQINKHKKELELYDLLKTYRSSAASTVTQLQQQQYIHPLIDQEDIELIKTIFSEIYKWSNGFIYESPAGFTDTFQRTFKDNIRTINANYSGLIRSIRRKSKTTNYHPYYGIEQSIIDNINEVLIKYLNIYKPLQNNPSNAANNMRIYSTNVQADKTKQFVNVTGVYFIWDKDTFGYDGAVLSTLLSEPITTTTSTVTAALLNAETLDPTAKTALPSSSR